MILICDSLALRCSNVLQNYDNIKIKIVKRFHLSSLKIIIKSDNKSGTFEIIRNQIYNPLFFLVSFV